MLLSANDVRAETPLFALASLNRYQAAGIHLAISTLVAATVLAALLLVWYPQPYFRLAGGPGLMLTLIGVDYPPDDQLAERIAVTRDLRAL